MLFICVFLSLTLGLAAAVPQDMSGKMLVFPHPTNTAHVRLTTSRQNLGAATVCLRYFTDIARQTSFFSLATPSHDNTFTIYKDSNGFHLLLPSAGSAFYGLDFQLNRWQSICATWDAASGLAQLWLDGKPSSLKLSMTSNISGAMIMVLGQEQDNHGGGFDINQSFVGMISDLHMWDSVLSPHHIDNYNQKFNFPEGNILNWKSIEFQIVGKVLIQKEQS